MFKQYVKVKYCLQCVPLILDVDLNPLVLAFVKVCNWHGGRFLDRAAVAKSSGVRDGNTGGFNEDQTKPATNLWKQCPLSQVEDVKQVVRLLPLWLTFIPASSVQVQLVTFFTLQGHTLEPQINHNFSIPSASLQCITTAAFLLCVVMYAMVKGRHVTPLQRISVGMLLSVVVMVVAAKTEAKRLKVNTKTNNL